MFHLIESVFDAPTLAAVREAAAALPFEDGQRSAGALARRVKANAQAAPGAPRDALLRKVEAALTAIRSLPAPPGQKPSRV
jgi:PKHD-type hydroxylase